MSNLAGSSVPIQQESIQFNNPVSESSLAGIGSPVNYMLTLLLPLGSVVDSTLTEAQFQAQLGNPAPATWILSDGRSIAGSALATLTGQANALDLRGVMTRGKNNGRSDGNQNPDGELAVGAFSGDRLRDHTHSVGNFPTGNTQKPDGSGNQVADSGRNTITSGGINGGSPVGGDTAPKNVTVNKFIRIN